MEITVLNYSKVFYLLHVSFEIIQNIIFKFRYRDHKIKEIIFFFANKTLSKSLKHNETDQSKQKTFFCLNNKTYLKFVLRGRTPHHFTSPSYNIAEHGKCTFSS